MSLSGPERGGKKQGFDLKAVATLLKSLVPSVIVQRVDAGRDINDKAFAGYSSGYVKALAKAGQNTNVDLRLTGGMLASVKARSVVLTKDKLEIFFAPDAGTSPAVSLGKTMHRTGARGPAHNIVGEYIHTGTPHMKPRPWMGLSPKDKAAVERQIRDIIVSR